MTVPKCFAGKIDLPDDEYHDLSAISNSDMKLFQRSPAHLYYAKFDPGRKPEEPTPAMIAGKILHMAILEPERFLDTYVALPPDAPRKPTQRQRDAKKKSPETIFSIEFWDAFQADNEGKTLLSADQMAEYQAVAAAVRNHPAVKGYFADCEVEQSILGQDPDTGIQCRIRPDLISQVGNYKVMLDFKSADDARPFRFMRSAHNFGYFQQAAFYPEVYKWAGLGEIDCFFIVAFEKKPPFGLKIYEPAPDAIMAATMKFQATLAEIKGCLETNSWPSYSSDCETLYMPAYADELKLLGEPE